MAANGRLAPDSYHHDPFATPSQRSEGSLYDGQSGAESSWHNTPAIPPEHLPQEHTQPIEMQNGHGANSMRGFGNASTSPKPSFLQRWKSADARAYAATIGSIGARRREGGEKQSAAQAGARRRTPAFLCSILAGLLLLAVIIAIVVPIAVVLGNKTKNNGMTGGSGSSDGSSSSPQPQNGGVITVQNGQYQGTNLPSGISSFLGMQYGAPPTGDLRWAAPQPPVNFTGVQAATKYAAGCIGLGTFNPKQSEDCLYLDVYAPTGASNNSKLPVYVYLQGGGLQDAATHMNGTNLILASGSKMITVTMTYRVNAFGFLASSEIQKSGALNIGLLDQRAAMQWVQKNIQQFGGDPNHVTLGGQSGGAGSVVNQLAAYGGRNDNLFQAAVMESQSVQAVRNVADSQFQYDYIVGNTTCDQSSDTLACLRKLPVDQLVSAIKTSPFPNGAGGDPVFPYNPVVDDDLIREPPVEAFVKGHFVNVPMIFGDVTDEGTIFVDKNKIHTRQDSEDFLRNTFPKINSTDLVVYSSLYKFGDTGAHNYWQNVAAAYGETRYTCPGVQLSSLATKANSGKIWNYLYDVKDPAAEAQGLGVRHGSELPAIWGPTGAPVSYQANQENANVIPVMQAYWTSFIKHFDPNAEKKSDAATWDAWTLNNRLQIETNSTAMETIDDQLNKRCQFLNSISVAIGQ